MRSPCQFIGTVPAVLRIHLMKPKFSVGARVWVIHGCILTWISGSGYKKTDMAKESGTPSRKLPPGIFTGEYEKPGC
jgi:hypothetical protein